MSEHDEGAVSKVDICACGEKTRMPTELENRLISHGFMNIVSVCDSCKNFMVNFSVSDAMDETRDSEYVSEVVSYTNDFVRELSSSLEEAKKDLEIMLASNIDIRLDEACVEENSNSTKFFNGNTLAGKKVKASKYGEIQKRCACGSHTANSFLLTNGERINQCSECFEITRWTVDCPGCGRYVHLVDDQPENCAYCGSG